MAKTKNKPEIKLKSFLKRKDIKYFNLLDKDEGLDFLVYEEHKDFQIHYPFYASNGDPRYSKVKKITYEDKKLVKESGYSTSIRGGYGFTRDLKPVIYALEDSFENIEHLIVSTTSKTQVIDDKTICFNHKDLNNFRIDIKEINGRHRGESKHLVNNILAPFFSDKFSLKQEEYSPGLIRNFLIKYDLKPENLSVKDMEAIANIIELLPADHEFVKNEKLIKTKSQIDTVFVEDIITKYDALLPLSKPPRSSGFNRLEDLWQDFFQNYILIFNFGYIQHFEKLRIEGDGVGNIPDFLLLNTYNYLDVLEIKTPRTELLKLDDGRTNFFWSPAASSAISQAENYIDSIIKQEESLSKRIRLKYGVTQEIQANRPTVKILASTNEDMYAKYSELDAEGIDKLKRDFWRLNNSLKNIRFVLYDEILEAFKNSLERLKNK